MSTLKIILAEDHNLVRAGLIALLHNIPGVTVLAEAANGKEALNLVEKHKPDVLLTDITMPEINGLELVRKLKQRSNVKIIILSMHSSEEYVWEALDAGANGYLLKDAGISELELAIKSVAIGQSYLSPAVSKHVIGNYIRRVNCESSLFEKLTPRQLQTLQLVAEGCTTKQIAEKLNISVKTVETHRTQLMEQLSIHDITGLVRYAVKMGLVSA
ncbi:MAG: response regulator transcription factor [Chloroflexi bacterium]|uniref:Response regulator transcription factor n=1 Tax=Candidatus Chlorohelix allophototropha TaxID=3003348 RepID=A0A8T7LYQ8_9CHLR|nr:response regulator transcription factor [Chloroflexota bacterium]WJW66488.1 response regulator transcription factor [Chloroflexota bacterium L227-S17]